ncbi:MerR family transcriptional regulator [Pontibacter cellulosilyticus]|uniref:MerR family transcriptional regulator n=1 Tax=Pontibacter cellulosilyticus TaxID=1720253 RepID=A0A923N6M8_9BACT|nr:MerR family transcriptional regulator [Pontibacter cellulosilyticus]MBC5992712.1 MerR family transcriptional regulator [Pontibacter cellulosilyticus]
MKASNFQLKVKSGSISLPVLKVGDVEAAGKAKLTANRISIFDLYIHEKTHRLNSDEISYRVLNNWEEQGLVNSKRDVEGGWRYYSLVDLIWLHLVLAMRKFGLPLKDILKVKKSIEKVSPKVREDLSSLDNAILNVIEQRKPIYLIVLEDGTGHLLSEEQYLADYLSFNCLKIGVSNMIRKLISLHDLENISKLQEELSDEEAELLQVIRENNYEKVTIQYKSGKISTVEGLERLDANVKLMEALKNHPYTEIKAINKSGKTVAVLRTVKHKINKRG